MTFLVKVLNQGDQYVKVTGDAIEAHIKPGDSAAILAEDGASLALAQETEEDAILAMTALSLPDSAETEATEKKVEHKGLVKKLQEKMQSEKKDDKPHLPEKDHKLHLPEKNDKTDKGNDDASTNR